MFKQNNGKDKQDILQNQFSAYLKKAVHNRRIRFLTDKSRREENELSQMNLESYIADDTDFMQELADYEAIQQALRSIKEKERRLVIARIVENKSFHEIAAELNMSYKATTSLYYRVMKRMKNFMDGGGEK